MNKEAMQQQIMEALSKKLGDGYSIQIHEVLKTNLKLDGLAILRQGDHISPTIYLESFYKELDEGTSLDDIIHEICSLYFHARVNLLDFDLSPIHDFSFVKKRLFVQLINRHCNTELLADVPHSLFLDDFAVTVRCLIDAAETGNASFLVCNSHMKMWGMEAEELVSLAVQNTRNMLGIDLRGMDQVLKEFEPGFDWPKTPLWVMTNKRKFAGASTVLFDDILRDFANAYGDFYVIFSSVHEALLLPAPDASDIDSITGINQWVNDTQLRTDEILGTKAYFYSRENGFACDGR